ncbi:MAG: outer membrane protein assembly factor BamD [Desulfosarcinaceae bacterium]|nr:outer membrane protein assembly factor BamD [Desulfosarcinaceae bacterium]
MKRRWLICVAALMLLNACAWLQEKEEKPADVLIEEGVEAFNAGDYDDAIEAFEQLRDWYPFSKYAILAELKIADAHFELGNYEEAVFAYEEFEQLHPRNEAIPYVIYRIGLCHFNRIDTVDRDQSAAQKALDTFNRLQQQFPDDAYAHSANNYIHHSLQSLAGHDFYVGMHYYKSKHFKAALERFRSVVTQYPDVGLHAKALNYIANCEAMIAREAAQASDVSKKPGTPAADKEAPVASDQPVEQEG